MMRVFEYIYDYDFGDGLAIVIAKNWEEADETIKPDNSLGYWVRGEEIKEVSPVGDSNHPYILAMRYYGE